MLVTTVKISETTLFQQKCDARRLRLRTIVVVPGQPPLARDAVVLERYSSVVLSSTRALLRNPRSKSFFY